ncbi:tRNA (adenosine(37)-N6)-threonylcarbamoyltransferase complex dimerization subunit type 1 TsaB [Candidatus Palibaumannia cicadellinicola]|uniref:tRNA threonylcarbamoyladenosine biosynthesis protein TsaB n=1 Tax=Baumannia cicadellinicola subsp. Homalodisca coagulata TaxID=374463 RepID=Q1LT26_BAUCH|nr:tRNA (adenosine(37)-N6)-threonylcarbamoyltransferase complex dimerization subunit type 1 TsaB [Candidatus Baumannia cicadellinicola]ABF13887.1 glycoprotease family protein [Baumannia cicadellinicola str. Hc (Homalodisca coagulata)]MBS0032790.1 tRNA (adenosine(37)-N6)-threonylcarbamoyltransferase complex dimerization subunit type 1 TsaB [Candidatus Baumannia cicadellinicola]MBS0032865.1 tRNA (adenosine(37)-N6)-threonylcarbamoyltransferase complex dimerization subunit type 1 TsaB [Candidatus Ba
MSVCILAIDTATEACSAALLINNHISNKFAITPRKHNQYILPMVDNLLTEAGITLSDLDALAFSCGPGSFTGVRTSIGIAQGLALGAKLSVIRISTLAILAQSTWRLTGASKVLVAIDARMGEIYCAQYYRNHEGIWLGATSEAVLKPEKLIEIIPKLTGQWACAGTGWITYSSLAKLQLQNINNNHKNIVALPSAQDMLPLALEQWRKCYLFSVDQIKPTYLRNQVAKKLR